MGMISEFYDEVAAAVLEVGTPGCPGPDAGASEDHREACRVPATPKPSPAPGKEQGNSPRDGGKP
jgi:hypothetical protein